VLLLQLLLEVLEVLLVLLLVETLSMLLRERLFRPVII
jgi:hypothetical protein